jgi:prevent-host-death family protein
MARYSVAEAKDGFSGLLDKALGGEEVVITRRGEPIAEIRPVRRAAPKPAASIEEWVKHRRDARGRVSIGSVELLDSLYDEEGRP